MKGGKEAIAEMRASKAMSALCFAENREYVVLARRGFATPAEAERLMT